MKYIFLCALVVIDLACINDLGLNENPIEGVFVKNRVDQFTKAIDTLQILSLNPAAGTFYCIQRTGFRRVRSGVVGPNEYYVDTSLGTYDKERNQISEQRRGRVYSFSSDRQELFAGSSMYKRVE